MSQEIAGGQPPVGLWYPVSCVPGLLHGARAVPMTASSDGRIEAHFARDVLTFPGDHELREQLRRSRSLNELWQDAAPLRTSETARGEMLRRRLRLTPRLAPELFHALDRCRERLGITAPFDVFCASSPDLDAAITVSPAGHLTLSFTSGLLEGLHENELCYVAGHELGHAALYHHEVDALRSYQERGDERLAPIDAMRLYAWSRYAELSADRVGLFCCGEFSAALSAEFKMSSGLTDQRFVAHAREAARQYTLVSPGDRHLSDEEDWFSVEPYGPLRIRALELFHQSKAYRKLQGRGDGSLSDEEASSQVDALLDVMNPLALDERAVQRDDLRKFLVYGGLKVALADSRFSRREQQVIERLVGHDRLVSSLDQLAALDPATIDAQVDDLASRLRVQLAPLHRKRLVEDLCAIALADRKLDARERQALDDIARRLDVSPAFVDDALARAARTLD